MARVVDEVRRFVADRALTGHGVVAVSGGADSVALLRAVLEVGLDVTVAHFNHRLRGAESDADEQFVRALAATLGRPVAVGSADVAALGGNLEETARRVRYDWLAGLGGEWVATGHTADDQAETVLHRLVRGTGVQGLRGIAAVRELGRGWLVRPMLTVTRTDVLAYLAELGQPFREDSSNADTTFTRNRIRAELLPLFKTFNPDVVAALGRLAQQADETTRFVQAAAGQFLDRVERPRAGGCVILDAGEPWPPFLSREMFRRLWDREGWPTDGMTADHWQRVVDVAAGAVGAADFPGGVHVRRAGRVVQVGPRS